MNSVEALCSFCSDGTIYLKATPSSNLNSNHRTLFYLSVSWTAGAMVIQTWTSAAWHQFLCYMKVRKYSMFHLPVYCIKTRQKKKDHSKNYLCSILEYVKVVWLLSFYIWLHLNHSKHILNDFLRLGAWISGKGLPEIWNFWRMIS